MAVPLGRAEAVSPGAHRIYRALIDHFLPTGDIASVAALTAATGFDAGEVERLLDELVVADWAGRDTAGPLVALYPFSVKATGILIGLAGVERHAMCAIDALGAASMLGQAVEITAACPSCKRPLRASVTPSGIESHEPTGLVVTRGRAPGPAQTTRCRTTRLACSPEHGCAWRATHGGPDDDVLPLDAAFGEAMAMFASCYSEGRSGCACG